MKILLTGGSERLGIELRALLPGVNAPPSADLNVTDAGRVLNLVERERPDVIVHAAAYTNVGAAKREWCWRVNVVGTRHVAAATNPVGAKLVHISTDYVFDGKRGDSREDDMPDPVANYYALTKLVAEEAARAARRHLILRTSVRPRQFQYPVAFGDVFTGQDYVDVIAPDIVLALQHAGEIEFDTLHIATERKSVYDLARRRRLDVREGSRHLGGPRPPGYVSLNMECWAALRAAWFP